MHGSSITLNPEFILVHRALIKTPFCCSLGGLGGGVYLSWDRYSDTPGKGCSWVGMVFVL